MNDQARATETISILKEVALDNREALNYITGLMRTYVGPMKYVTWSAQIKDRWFYIRIAKTDGSAAHEIHIPTDLYTTGDYDLIDAHLVELVGRFIEEVQDDQ